MGENLMSQVSSTYTNHFRDSRSPEKKVILTPHADFLGWHEEVENGEEARLSVQFLLSHKVKWQSKSHLQRLD